MNRTDVSKALRVHRGDVRAHRQRGVALAVSLMLLAAMTVIGIATLSSARTNEQIASNGHQKSAAFEAAESAIGWAWDLDTVLGSLPVDPDQSYHEPPAVVLDGLAGEFAMRFDQERDGQASLDIDGFVSVRYCGESALPMGSDLNVDESRPRLVATLFDVNGVAGVAGSGARSDNVQRGSLTRPATARRGGCTAPGEPS